MNEKEKMRQLRLLDYYNILPMVWCEYIDHLISLEQDKRINNSIIKAKIIPLSIYDREYYLKT